MSGSSFVAGIAGPRTLLLVYFSFHLASAAPASQRRQSSIPSYVLDYGERFTIPDFPLFHRV